MGGAGGELGGSLSDGAAAKKLGQDRAWHTAGALQTRKQRRASPGQGGQLRKLGAQEDGDPLANVTTGHSFRQSASCSEHLLCAGPRAGEDPQKLLIWPELQTGTQVMEGGGAHQPGSAIYPQDPQCHAQARCVTRGCAGGPGGEGALWTRAGGHTESLGRGKTRGHAGGRSSRRERGRPADTALGAQASPAGAAGLAQECRPGGV